MARVNAGQFNKRDLTAGANEIADLKRELGIGDQPSFMLQGAEDDGGGKGDGSEGVPAMRYGSIVVAVRKRPKIPNREEDQNDVIKCGEGRDITVYAPKVKVDLTPIIEPTHFVFDEVFSERQGNAEVYEKTTRPLLQTVREGGSAVVFAFGQTGSGKTYTMMGYPGKDPGLYSLAVEEVFHMLGSKVKISASFYEIYGVKCFDLLNERNEVKVMQDEYKNVHVVGIVERRVETHDDILDLMKAGSELRSSGQTHANDRSSRSHAVLVINLKTKVHGALYSRMTFVDLAGSERASDTTNTDKKTQREGAEINKSLLALKECIRAMGMRKRHIPFRGSKLTQILRESFIGNCSTCVIANVSPCQSHCEDTLNTLRYADRIKELKGDGNGADIAGAAAIPCANCGDPIFVGDRHICRRVMVQCQYCREGMEKDRLEDHLTSCKEAPAPCPYCFARVVQGDVAKHQKKCLKIPVKCPMCEVLVPRETLPKHQKDLCVFARVPCRHCRALFPRGDLDTHEDDCMSQQVVCPHCLMPMKKLRIETHMSSECTSSGGRAARVAIPQTARGESVENNNNANRFQRSPSVGNPPTRKPSMGRSPTTNSNANNSPAIVQGAHGIAQLAKQNKNNNNNYNSAGMDVATGSDDGGRRPYTMNGNIGVATDMRLPRLSALERGANNVGNTNVIGTVPPSGARRSPSNGTPRGGNNGNANNNDRRTVSAQGKLGGASNQQLGRLGGGGGGGGGGERFPQAFSPVPPPPQSSGSDGSSNFIRGVSGSPNYHSNNNADGGPIADCQFCKCRLPSGSVMDRHVAFDCQFAPVSCAFSKYGCTAPLHRIHLTKHMQESMSLHLELVVEYAESMARENDELRYLLATQTPQGGRSGATTPRGGFTPVNGMPSNSNIDDVAAIIARSNHSNPTVPSPIPRIDHDTTAQFNDDGYGEHGNASLPPDASLNMAANTISGGR